MSATLIDTAEWWRVEHSEQLALVSGGDSVSHGDLGGWAEAIAAWLHAEGLTAGDRVTVLACNSFEWGVMAHAAVRAGVLMAPISHRFTVNEASYMLGRYEPKFLFYDEERAEAAQALQQQMPGLRIEPLTIVHRFRSQANAGRAERGIHADTPVAIIPTSGSTGYPKGVVYSHRTMMNYITELAIAEPQATDRPRILVFGPMSSSAGYVVATQTLAYGGTVYLEENFDAERALRLLVDEKISLLMGAPVFFERIAACPGFAEADLSSIRLIQTGGARVSQQLLQTWLGKGVVLRQIYGQTESGGTSTINSSEASITHPEKCGRGLPFTRLAIVGPDGKPCPPDVPGEILIQGPSLMVGYWNDPEATEKAMAGGWLHTGDLGVLDAQGQLTMLDRLKDIIISGGLNISAAELERVVSDFQGVEEVAVIAAKDDRFGETPLAVIYATADIDVQALIAHCTEQLSSYKVMRYVALTDAPLPRLGTGKISKPALRQRYADAHLTLPPLR